MPVEFNKFRDPKAEGQLVAIVTVDVSARLSSVGLPAREVTLQCLQDAQQELSRAIQAVQSGQVDSATIDEAKAKELAEVEAKYAKISPPVGIEATDVAAAVAVAAEAVEVKP